MENLYLFGAKFEEELIKINSEKQKSKSVFTGLQQRKQSFSLRPNYNLPFLSGPLPGNQQGGLQVVQEENYFSQEQQQPEVKSYLFSLLNRI